MKSLRKYVLTLATLATLLATGASPGSVRACRNSDAFAVPLGAGIGAAAMIPWVFGFPAMANDLDYWPGVGWTFLGASLGLAAGVGVQMATDDCFSNLWVPPVFATAGALVSTLAWGLTAKRKSGTGRDHAQARLPVLVGISPLPEGGVYANASLAW